MELYNINSTIDLLNGQIQEETEHYYEAITQQKDFTAARNIRHKISLLQKNLQEQMLQANATSNTR